MENRSRKKKERINGINCWLNSKWFIEIFKFFIIFFYFYNNCFTWLVMSRFLLHHCCYVFYNYGLDSENTRGVMSVAWLQTIAPEWCGPNVCLYCFLSFIQLFYLLKLFHVSQFLFIHSFFYLSQVFFFVNIAKFFVITTETKNRYFSEMIVEWRRDGCEMDEMRKEKRK